MTNLNKMTQSLFFISLIIGIYISISSNNPLMIWLGMEINLISFLPLMLESNSNISASNIMKYFLIQTITSLFILFLMISYLSHLPSTLFILILSLSAMVKMGLPPYHFWLPSLMMSMNWKNCFILSTIQKLTPLLLLMTVSFLSKTMTFLFLTSLFISTVGGLKQSHFRPLMAYSSMHHMIWCLLALFQDLYLFYIYFLLYLITCFTLFTTLNKFYNSSFYNNSFSINSNYFFISLIMIFSMAGLPPLLGFFPKLSLLNSFINSNFLITFSLLVSSMINLYFYLNFSFSIISNKKMLKMKMHKNSIFLIILPIIFTLSPLMIIFFALNMFH